ncbi:cytochrome P450 [Endogone sp. FLAS-F59071]|nr:cytochrome P450 [Endogone sp. FLAS-F59071]|eukprot:RUS20632.1 cytochrome P450 [Endogone sp. FLAS-F59071]
MASLTSSHLIDSFTSISRGLMASIRDAPSTSVFSSIATVATVYLVLFHVLEVNKPASYRKIPSKTGSIIRSMLSRLNVPATYETCKDLFEKHGILRANLIQSERVEVASPEYARVILTQLDDFPKIDLASKDKNSLIVLFFGVNLVFSNDEVWKRHRRAANPAFHRAWNTQVFGETKGFCLMSMIFHKGANNPLYFMFPWLDYIPFVRRRKTFARVHHFNDLIDGLIDTRRKELAVSGIPDNKHADLLTLMIKAGKDQEKGPKDMSLTDLELRNNMTILFLAGHDTTANSLACAMYFLAVHQDAQRKAREEVLALLSANSTALAVPTFDETKQLPYLTNVIKETLRLCPSVAAVSGRMTTRDVPLGEYVIPKGTSVGINVWALHHSRKIWGDDVEEFKPERFKDHVVDEKLADPDATSPAVGEGKRDNYAWLPFSFGARACIGMNLSYLEQRVVLSMLLQKYEWVLPADSPHKEKLQFAPGNLLRPLDLQIQFKKRY